MTLCHPPVMGLSPEVITMLALLPPILLNEDKEPIIQHDSALTGQDYYDELMETENTQLPRFGEDEQINFPRSLRYVVYNWRTYWGTFHQSW